MRGRKRADHLGGGSNVEGGVGRGSWGQGLGEERGRTGGRRLEEWERCER